jgi:hypothetical protein
MASYWTVSFVLHKLALRCATKLFLGLSTHADGAMLMSLRLFIYQLDGTGQLPCSSIWAPDWRRESWALVRSKASKVVEAAVLRPGSLMRNATQIYNV